MIMSDLSNGDRSVHIGGDVSGSVIQTGDNNRASVSFQQASLPTPEAVDIAAEVAALRELLATLQTPHSKKIERALDDAQDELEQPEPDRDEVGRALGRALDYAQKVDGLAEIADKLKPHVTNAVGWLGNNWHKLLGVVGLVV